MPPGLLAQPLSNVRALAYVFKTKDLHLNLLAALIHHRLAILTHYLEFGEGCPIINVILGAS